MEPPEHAVSADDPEVAEHERDTAAEFDGVDEVPATNDPDCVVTQLTDHRRSRRRHGRHGGPVECFGSHDGSAGHSGLSAPSTAGYGEPVVDPAAASDLSARPTGSGLFRAVALILASDLPGQPQAPRSAMDTVLGSRMRVAGTLSAEAAASHTAALIVALLHSGQAEEAADLADREGMFALHRVAGTAPAATQSACYSVLAEAYFFVGRLRDSVACGRFARSYAEEAADDGCLFRAMGVLACALAMSGDISAARKHVDAATELGEPAGWLNHHSAGFLLFAEILLLARSADASNIERAIENLTLIGGNDVLLRCVTRYCIVILQSVRHEFRELMASTRLMVQGTDAPSYPSYMRDLATSMEAIGHIQLGDPGTALTVLAGRTSTPEHSVCFEVVRATAYLQLGHFREVIDITDGCVGGHREHSIGTLVSVLLRRAMAYEALGLHASADAEYSHANHIALDSGLLSATLGIDVPALRLLFDRMAANQPEFSARVLERVPNDSKFPVAPKVDFERPQLTKREVVLGERLMTELSMREIADEQHVSINTVKSQVRTLYRKLGVTSREEAAFQWRRLGLHRA